MINFLQKFFFFLFFVIFLKFGFSFLIEKSNLNFKNSYSSIFVFFSNFFPLNLSKLFLLESLFSLWVTISIASIAVFFSMIISFPLAIIFANNLTYSSMYYGKKTKRRLIVNFIFRTNITFLRSIPELLLAIIFVRLFGLGATSAVMSITICYIGFFTKIFIEIIESTNVSDARNLMINGITKFNLFFYSILPLCKKEIISYVLFRWECAIRTSIILGIVGAGGIGQKLDFAIKMSEFNDAGTILILLFLFVLITEKMSKFLRNIYE